MATPRSHHGGKRHPAGPPPKAPPTSAGSGSAARVPAASGPARSTDARPLPGSTPGSHTPAADDLSASADALRTGQVPLHRRRAGRPAGPPGSAGEGLGAEAAPHHEGGQGEQDQG